MSGDRFAPEDFARDSVGHGTHAIDPSGCVHGIHPSIRDALIEQGLLALDGDGVWRFTGEPPDLSTAHYGYLAVCDFCSARPAPWTIPCVSFNVPRPDPALPEARSIGDWAACDRCGSLIAARNATGLLQHCLRHHHDPDAPRDLRLAVKRAQKRMHARFWRHYRGGAVRGTARPFGH